MNYFIKTGVFSLVGNYLRPSNNYRQLIYNIKLYAVVLILMICLRFSKLVKYLPEFYSMIHGSWQWFTVQQDECIDVNRRHGYKRLENHTNIIHCYH